LDQFDAAAERALLLVLVPDRRAESDDEQAPLVAKIDLTKMTAPPVDGSHGANDEVLQPVNGL
jgi:hypothetical protein